jgi:flagellar basal body-associated protein FliL
VNVKGTNASRFLVVSVMIDSGQDAQRAALYEILEAKDAFIRDMALEILSEFSMEDLADEPAAKNKVKIQMQERLSQYITDKKLDYSVLFTQWAIQ